MGRIYLSYDPEQQLLLPPDLREWLPEGHLALFISDVVDELDLSVILRHYESGDGRGRPPYHPLMMVKLLV
jgi:transposase